MVITLKVKIFNYENPKSKNQIIDNRNKKQRSNDKHKQGTFNFI